MTTNDTPGPNLTGRDRQVAALVAEGRTHAEVAAALNLSKSTIDRTARKPGFRELVRETRTAAASTAAGALVASARSVVDELVRLTKEATSKDGVKVAACRAVLEFGERFGTVSDLRAEIEELKTLLSTRETVPTWLPAPEAPREKQGSAAILGADVFGE